MATLSLSHMNVPCHWHSDSRVQLHGTAVCVDGEAVLILGAAGAGKSSYAAYLIAGGATLIADDQVICHLRDGQIMLSAPPPIEGVLALRDHGLMRCAVARDIPLRELRVMSPEVATQTATLMGLPLPCNSVAVPEDIADIVAVVFAQAKQAERDLSEEWIAEVA